MYGFGDASNTDLVSHYLSTLFQGVPLVGQPRGSTVMRVATSVKGNLQEDFQEEDDKAQSAEDDDNDDDVVVYQSDAEDFHKEEGEAWESDRLKIKEENMVEGRRGLVLVRQFMKMNNLIKFESQQTCLCQALASQT